MSWPDPSDYQDAIQNPRLCFADSGLRGGSVALTPLGLPRVMSGNFASVYEIRNGQSRWAVRCMLRQIAGQEKRYAALSQQLVGMRLPCLVGFEYLTQGIRVKGQWYPIVKMEWAEGEALHLYVERYLNDGKTLLNLAAQWRGLVNSLRGNGIAHGDLQHGNVLVTPNGQIALVDYDAMYVPALRGQKCPELGQDNFQHPLRTADDFNESLDNFAALVIYTSLRALAVEPGLWRQYHTGENLIFGKQDFLAPRNSPVFRSLAGSPDKGVRLLAEALMKCCLGPITQVSALESFVASLPPPPTVTASRPSPAQQPIPFAAGSLSPLPSFPLPPPPLPRSKPTPKPTPPPTPAGISTNWKIAIFVACAFLVILAIDTPKKSTEGASEVTITISNEDCWPQDFYLNNQRVTTISAKSSGNVTVRAGKYTTRACAAGTSNCGDYSSVTWTPGAANQTLLRSPACASQDAAAEREQAERAAKESTLPIHVEGAVTSIIFNSPNIVVGNHTVSIMGISSFSDRGFERFQKVLRDRIRVVDCVPTYQGLYRCTYQDQKFGTKDFAWVALSYGSALVANDAPQEYRDAQVFAQGKELGRWGHTL